MCDSRLCGVSPRVTYCGLAEVSSEMTVKLRKPETDDGLVLGEGVRMCSAPVSQRLNRQKRVC